MRVDKEFGATLRGNTAIHGAALAAAEQAAEAVGDASDGVG